MNLRQTRCLVPALIAALTFLTFYPVLHNGYIFWDDWSNLLINPMYRGWSLDHLRWMLTTTHMGVYIPLTWMSFALDYTLWGMNPFGHHLVNLFLHTANAVLLYEVAVNLYRLSGKFHAQNFHETQDLYISAGLAALLFAIHPLRVESVASITERRDVLCGFFFLLTLLAYLKSQAFPEGSLERHRWVVASIVLFGLSLLSKAASLCLPGVLILLDIYPLGRRSGQKAVWQEKIPFFLLMLPAGIMAMIGQRKAHFAWSFASLGWGPRLILCLNSLGFYIEKTLWPFHLSPFYELPPNGAFANASFLLRGFFFLACTVLVLFKRKKAWALFVAWMSYALLVLPVSGLFQSGRQMAADRYSYLPTMSFAILLGGLVWAVVSQKGLRDKYLYRSCAIALSLPVLAALMAATHRQTGVWHDDRAFISRVLQVEPDSAFGHNNEGLWLAHQGKLVEATREFKRACERDPAYENARLNYNHALSLQSSDSSHSNR